VIQREYCIKNTYILSLFLWLYNFVLRDKHFVFYTHHMYVKILLFILRKYRIV